MPESDAVKPNFDKLFGDNLLEIKASLFYHEKDFGHVAMNAKWRLLDYSFSDPFVSNRKWLAR